MKPKHMRAQDRQEVEATLRQVLGEAVIFGFAYVGERTIALMARAAAAVYENGLEVEEHLKSEGMLK